MAIPENDRVFTAPLAIIKIGGVTVGKIRNITLQEQYTRGTVKGLGVLVASEVPLLDINCTFNCDSYVIDIDRLGTIENPFVLRGAGTKDIFLNTVLLQDNGVDIYIFKKVTASIVNGLVEEVDESAFVVVKDVYLESQQFTIQEQQIAGQSMTGRYLVPCITDANNAG